MDGMTSGGGRGLDWVGLALLSGILLCDFRYPNTNDYDDFSFQYDF